MVNQKNKKLHAKQESMNPNGGKQIKSVSTISVFCTVKFYSKEGDKKKTKF